MWQMRKVLNELETAMAAAIADYRVSCKRGCASCCHSLVLITIPEAMALLPYVTPTVRAAIDRWRALFPALASLPPPGVNITYQNEEAYWRMGVPCPLLSPVGECTAYSVRPGVCRFTFATSSAEQCAPGLAQEVIDASVVHEIRFRESDVIARANGWPPGAHPLPAALHFCLTRESESE